MYRYYVSLVAFTAAVLVLAAEDVHGQNCNCTVAHQPFAAPMVTTVWIDASAEPLRGTVEDAVRDYNEAFAAAGSRRSVVVVGSPTDEALKFVLVQQTPDDSWGQWAGFQHGNYIYIPDKTVNQGASWLARTVRHEMSHPLGFQSTGSSCSGADSVMVDAQPWQSFPTSLTCADFKAIADRYEPEDPPAGHGGGCRDADPDCTPLIVSFDSTVPRMSSPDVPFDLAGTGAVRVFSWPEGDQEAAFLMYDRNGNWKVDDGRELFGNATPMSWGFSGDAAGDGFEALSFFDSPLNGGNGDRMLDARDQVFQDLRLWFDRNHDGRSSDEELEWLSDRVGGISLDVHSSMKRDRYGNVFRYRSLVTFTDPMRGRRQFGFVWDVNLANIY